ncbi:MAG: hypothetical protein GKS06_01640 [Acidobacteria bacterium]|nr:hypothetical protein [Acidobacteriota bacterium]
MKRACVALIFASVLASCSPAEPEATGPEWGGSIEERDGVTWVVNPSEAWWDGDSEPFTLRLDRSFGNDETGPEAGLLNAVMGAAVDAEGNVYTVDSWKHRMVAFAADGTFRWSQETEGEGPGDLSHPYNAAWDGGDRIYIDNQNGGRIDWWTLDGTFAGTQPLSDFGLGQSMLFGFLDPGRVVLGERLPGRDGVGLRVFAVSDTGWEPLSSFEASGGRDATEEAWGGWLTSARVSDGSIFAGHAMDYQLARYSATGDLETVWTRPIPTLLPPISYRGTGTNFGEYEAPLRLPSGHYLVHHQRLEGFESHDDYRLEWDQYLESGGNEAFRSRIAALDLLDAEGRYLGSVAFEEVERILDVGPDGYLYTARFEPVVELRRYEIILAPELARGAETS